MAKSKEEITKQVEPQAIQPIPEYLRRPEGQSAAGLEQMERQDITFPRLGLCQALSPQRNKNDIKFIPGLEEGDFFNTVTKEIYGPKVRLVPLLFYKQRIRFGAMDDGGGILCQAPDNLVGIGDPGGICLKCSMAQFQQNEPPECDQFFNYMSLVPRGEQIDQTCLAVFSLKSTGLKIAREFNALMRMKGTDSFAGVYELNAVHVSKDTYNWYAPKIDVAGFVSENVYKQAQVLYAMVAEMNKAGKLKHDVEDLRNDAQEFPAEM